jgi:RHS repeat-associated protein
VYEETNGQIRTYHYDLRGSTIGLADHAGAVSARLTYGPYGERATADPPDTPFQHHGLFGVITGPTGLEYMRFRWYSPELKRFLNRDAHFGDISVAGSLNPYAFGGNNPAIRTDPEGQFWWVAAGAIIGAVAAVTVKAASDLISGKFSGWQSYAGAALGGAVTGGALALCPTCGIAAGALGAAAAYSAEKGFRGQRVEPTELLTEAAFGAAAGGVSGGAGRLTGKLAGKALGRLGGGSLLGKFGLRGGLFGNFGKQAARRAVFGRGDIIAQSLKRELPLGFVRGALASAGSQAASLTGVAAAGDRFLLDVATSIGLVGSTEGAPGTTSVKDEILSDGRLEVNASRKSRYGEFIHWNFWLENLKLAARPIPNNPNNLLTSF